VKRNRRQILSATANRCLTVRNKAMTETKTETKTEPKTETTTEPKTATKPKTKNKTKMNLQIAHQVPGRVRMKIPSGKGNAELLKQIGEVFGAIPGIEEVEVNPTTGSVVLRYDTDRHDEFHGTFNKHYAAHSDTSAPNGAARGQNGGKGADTDLDKLTGSIEAEAEFLASHSHSARAIVDFVKKVDREIKIATGNSVDLKILFAVGMIGFTVLEIGATAATPVWVTLAIFSVNHFIELHERQLQQDVAEIETPNLAPIRVAG
jgi:Heavy metal associated domain 2